jgi:hypothetical protein
MVTLQKRPLFTSQPIHVSNWDPTAGDAVSVSGVPLSKEAVQVVVPGPQSIPGSLETTEPRPAPAFASVSVGFLKVAEIDRAPVMVAVQVVVDVESHPLHAMKSNPFVGVAVNVTTVFAS